ncbi:MAG TPA: hypothetical protein VLY23_05090 [Candidatus Acidoferrum sp.]|nr:hypothetical protein [Candidatus Acidoferrum sp.]
MSRIWDALKEAEEEKARATQRGHAEPDKPREKPPEKGSSERRRSQRRVHRVALLVYGRDAEQQPFHEEAYTLEVNDNGCLLSLETTVARGQRLFLTHTRNQAEQECRVVTVGRRVRGRARVAIQFSHRAHHFWQEA